MISRAALCHGMYCGRYPIKASLFLHMTTRNNLARLERHEALWKAFNEQAQAMAEGPDTLETQAAWIRGESAEEAGVLVQNIVGRFFKPGFGATHESWQATLRRRLAAASGNVFKQWWCA